MEKIGWLGIILAFVGAGSLLWGLIYRSKANAVITAANGWPTARGTIIAVDIVKGGSFRAPTFAPVARYEYQVDGRRFFGDRIRPGYVKVGSRRAAEKILQPYSVGRSVQVRYEPANPDSSVLELTTSSSPMIMIILGAAFLLVGGGFTVAVMMGAFADGKGRPEPSAAHSDDPAPVTSLPATAAAAGPTRTWRGSYTCGQGETGLEVTLRPLGQGRLEGTFAFFPSASNPTVPRGCFSITGQADRQTRRVSTRAGAWRIQPPGYSTVDLQGPIRPNGDWAGQVTGGACSNFVLRPVPAPQERCGASGAP